MEVEDQSNQRTKNRGSFGTTKNLFNEAILEEGLQGVTTATANIYREHLQPEIHPPEFDLMGAVYESMSHQYGSQKRAGMR
jgi:hypothetical protein